MRAYEYKTFTNIAATTAAFTLLGGKYGVEVTATGAGTVKLQRRSLDGATFVSVSAATDFATVAGYAVIDLPPGTYQFTVATFTAIFAEIARIPND